MAIAAVFFVSKRLQPAAAALLCLTAFQLMISLSTCHPEPLPMGAARVAIRH